MTNNIIYILALVLFVLAMCKQFTIITRSPKGDPNIVAKVIFLVFTMLVVLTTWILYEGITSVAMPLFLAASIIIFWTYYISKNKPS